MSATVSRNRASGRVLLRIINNPNLKRAIFAGFRLYHKRALVGLLFYLLLLWRSSRTTFVKQQQQQQQHSKPTAKDQGQPQKQGAWRNFLSSHSILIEYILTKATIAATSTALLLQAITTHVVSAPVYAANFVSKQTLSLQDVVQNRVEIWLEEQMDTVGEKVKTMIKDPYMPSELLSMIDDTVDLVLPDIKLALLMKTDEYLKYRFPVTWYREPTSLSSTSSATTWTGTVTNYVSSLSAPVPTAWLTSRLPASLPIDATSWWPWGSSSKPESKELNPGAQLPKRLTNGAGKVDKRTDILSRLTWPWKSDAPSAKEEEVAVDTVKEQASSQTGSHSETEQETGDSSAPEEDNPSSTKTPDDVDILLDEFNRDSPSTVSGGGNKTYKHWTRWRYLVHTTKSKWLGCKGSLKEGRAYVLYSLSPYDKTFWQNAREARFLILNAIGLLPKFGVVWWLVVFLMQDKRDEFGMCQFIIGFQTAKFFSQGCFSLLHGALLFYNCSNRDIPTCDVAGPRVSDYFDAFGFTLQILLVWVSFFILPYTVPCRTSAASVRSRSSGRPDGPSNHVGAATDRPPPPKPSARNVRLQQKVTQTRANRLAMLFWWDTCSVVLVIALTAVTIIRHPRQQDWQLKTTLYWLRTLYGLLSLPFVLFKLPLMGNLLTPSKATGYHPAGLVVLRGANVESSAGPEKAQLPRALDTLPPAAVAAESQLVRMEHKLEHELAQEMVRDLSPGEDIGPVLEKAVRPLAEEGVVSLPQTPKLENFAVRNDDDSTGSSTSAQSVDSESNSIPTGSLWRRRHSRRQSKETSN